MSESFDLEAPDHFTAGAVGAPGQRVFYVQGRQAGRVITLKAEKEQVGGLAEYLQGLLAKSPVAAEEMPPDLGLLEPVNPAWDVGAVGVGYDERNDRILVVANEMVESEEDEEEEGQAEAREAEKPEGATARFRITRAQAARFVERARALMKAGRPTCQVCGGPIDPGGHLCPRRNGHKP